MYGHLVVGATGTGKTTYTENLIKKIGNFNALSIFYMGDSIGQRNDYADIPDKCKWKDVDNFTGFCDEARRTTQGVIVFEEATVFLTSFGKHDDIRRLLVRKRHDRNYVILIFHSLMQVPPSIYRLCTHLTLFKTTDSYNSVSTKFTDPRLDRALIWLQKQDKGTYPNFPKKVISIY